MGAQGCWLWDLFGAPEGAICLLKGRIKTASCPGVKSGIETRKCLGTAPFPSIHVLGGGALQGLLWLQLRGFKTSLCDRQLTRVTTRVPFSTLILEGGLRCLLPSEVSGNIFLSPK